jgi:hypothetical protein
MKRLFALFGAGDGLIGLCETGICCMKSRFRQDIGSKIVEPQASPSCDRAAQGKSVCLLEGDPGSFYPEAPIPST